MAGCLKRSVRFSTSVWRVVVWVIFGVFCKCLVGGEGLCGVYSGGIFGVF